MRRACHRNGIDVDKFDYLMRDPLMTRRDLGYFDCHAALAGARVWGGQVVYEAGQYDLLARLFQLRKDMHRQVYTHR